MIRVSLKVGRWLFLGVLVTLQALELQAATLVWNNPAGGNWSLAANWTPSQLPTAGDTVSIALNGSYTVTVDTAVAVSQLTVGAASGTQTFVLAGGTLAVSGAADFGSNTEIQWNSGGFAGAGTIVVHGPMVLATSADKSLNTVVLRTLGAVTWTTPGRILGYNFGAWQNEGALDASDAVSVVWGGLGNGPRFVNTGTATFGTNVSFATANVLNAGIFRVQSGALSISGSNFTNAGALHLDADAFAHFDSGDSYLGGEILAPTADSIRFRGADVRIDTVQLGTPAIWQSGGTVRQRTNVVVAEYHQSAGTWLGTTLPVSIGTYSLTNGEFRGQGLTVSNFVWQAGSVNRDGDGSVPVLTVPVGGSLTMKTLADRYNSTYNGAIPGYIVNLGTATWEGGRLLGNYFSAFENLGSLTVTAPASVVWAGFGSGPRFANHGTLNATGDFSFSSVNWLNAGTWTQQGGALGLTGVAATNTGSLNLGAAALANFDSGDFYVGGAVTAAAADSLRFRGIDARIDTIQLSTPAIWQSGGTVRQRTNVVVAEYHQSAGTWLGTTLPLSIGTYSLTNGEFRGQGLTVSNFVWQAGSVNRDGDGSVPVLTVPAGGSLTMKTSADRYNSTYNGAIPGHIVNLGTATWEGGRLLGNYFSAFENLGSLTVTAPASVVWAGFGSGPRFANHGTLNAAGDFSFSSVNWLNAGTWTQQGGALGLTSVAATNTGSLNLGAAALANFDGGDFYVAGSVTAPTADSLRFRGIDARIDTAQIGTPAIWQSGGTVRQRANVAVAEYHQSAGTWLGTTLPISVGTYSMTNGEFRGQGLTVSNFVWQAGSVNRDGDGSVPVLTIPAGGSLTMKTTADRYNSTYNGAIPGHIRNLGAATWEGGRLLGNYFSAFENLGSLAVTAPASVVWAGFGSGPRFANHGTLNATGDFSFSSVNWLNAGTWTQQGGALGLTSVAATNTGSLNLSAAAVGNFDSGDLYLGGSVTAPAADSLRFRGIDARIDTVQIGTPAIWQSAGTVRQRTNVVVAAYHQSAGTWLGTTLPLSIGTYSMTNGEFRGQGLTVSNFVWQAGSVNRDGDGSVPVLTVPVGGSMALKTTADKTYSTYNGAIPSHIRNLGTATWEGGRLLGNYFSAFENLGSLTVTAPASVVWAGFGSGPRFANHGTLNAAGDFSFSSVNWLNAGTWTQQGGALGLTSVAATNTGSLNLGAAALGNFDAGDFYVGGSVTAPTADSLRFRGIDARIDTIQLSTPAIWQSGGTVRQRTNVVVAEYHQSAGTLLGTTLPVSIGTYSMTNGEFRGQGLTVSNFVWQAGSVNRDGDGSVPVLTVPVGGSMAMKTSADKTYSTYNGTIPCVIRNLGTATWDGGRLLANYHSLFENSGTLGVNGSASLVWAGFGAGPRFYNAGSVAFATDFSFTSCNVTNVSTWILTTGTQTYSSCTLGQSAGSFKLGNGRVTGAGTTAEFTGGLLAGNGEFGLPFVNKGATVSPGASPGVLQFPSFNMASGVLDVELGRGIPGTNSDLIRVIGAATVGGTLKMKLFPGVGTNDQYTVLTAATRTGTFDTLQQPPNGILEATYSATNVVLNLKELFQGSAPNVVLQPLDITTNQGATVTFNTTVSGSEPFTFQWQRGETDLDGATSTNLTLAAVQQSLDAGVYALVVRNDYGSSTSRVARLNIRVPDAPVAGELSSVAHWRFDEPAGSAITLDSSGNHYDGLLSATGASFVDGGRLGRAISLTRSQSGWVNFGKILPFNASSFSAVIWVKFTDPEKPAIYGDFMARHAGGLTGYRLGLQPDGPLGRTGQGDVLRRR